MFWYLSVDLFTIDRRLNIVKTTLEVSVQDSKSMGCKLEGIDPASPPYGCTCFADATSFEKEIFV